MPAAGDEPHFLVFTHSLVHGRDLDLGDDYAVVYPHLRPEEWHTAVYRPGGARVSTHPIGLPLLIALPYWLGERAAPLVDLPAREAAHRAAMAAAVLASALLAATTLRLALELTGRPLASALAWASVFFTNPVLPYGPQLMPELPAAAAAVLALYLARRAPPSRPGWLALGLCIGALPWIHPRYGIQAGVLGVYALWRARARGRFALAAVAATGALSLGLLCLYSWVAYDSPSPGAAYRLMHEPLTLAAVPSGLYGLFFDQARGLFAQAPLYLLALPGWAWLLARAEARQRAPLALAAALFVAPVLPSAAFYAWDGGYAVPPRYLVPVLPLAVLPLAVLLARGRPARAALAALLVGQLTLLGYTLAEPERYFSVRVSSGLLADVSRDAERLTGLPLRLVDRWPTSQPPPFWFHPSELRRTPGVGELLQPDGDVNRQRLRLDPAEHGPGFAAYGPYVVPPSGRYAVLALLEGDEVEQEGVVAVFDVAVGDTREARIAARREIRGTDFERPGQLRVFELELAHDGLERIQTRLYFTGRGRVGLVGTGIVSPRWRECPRAAC